MAQYQHMLMRGSRTYLRNRHHHTFMRNYNMDVLTCSIHLMSHISIPQMYSIFKSSTIASITNQQDDHPAKSTNKLPCIKRSSTQTPTMFLNITLKLLDIHKFKASPPQELPMKGVQVSLVRKTPTDA